MTSTGIFHTILLMGVLQGIILTVLLFAGARKRPANRFLAWVMAIFGLACFNLLINELPIFNISVVINVLCAIIPGVLVMPVGPLLYFYIMASLEPGFRLTKQQRWHFAPVLIDVGGQLAAIIFFSGVLLGLLPNRPAPWGNFIDTYNVYADIPRWMSVTIYLVLAYRYLQVHSGNGSYGRWLRTFIGIFLVFQAIWFIYLVPYVIPSLSNKLLDLVGWAPVYIPLVALLYTIGIKGLLAPAKPEELRTAVRVTPPPNTDAIVAQLRHAMEVEKLYLQPELNLALLSKHTGIAAKTISLVLNQYVNKSFNEFVNGYRIADFQQKVRQPGFGHMTLMGVAFESGFNSQATFQRAFKQQTGTSPTEYLRQIAEVGHGEADKE
ncbi:transcriptional regulator, AraC family [Chitinophaga jiangningensis]|uniref:Transcriptional regulator, AraC family n=1 Tax=Chitinophaga jiangningensis TaxID=1419482 RepID=A0A1M7N2D3_9BACT|nr:helix-turn-helix domain-containing protein [Chitinophaga jiangningensis]SHM97682.1 transcriptional regulator, AraC family [Chitinophaga jiangningensis]